MCSWVRFYWCGMDFIKKLKMTNQKTDIDQEILEEIIKAIQQIKYGEVMITIHDGKVVEIEQKRKKRFKVATARAELKDNIC